ncbi:hypothetical protein E1B28_001279 [Marasmius oreades]|uniref:Uncharacterized protein n=1 Tax=Marasmius oreades TaxID=181124 RepID=A0A9P7V3E7_9AGAR|nr:uncharacterized protein E1B28_001279 [Marasmius oreades]KAG7099427.1 hypothetical protein E1B28_001279 [Marasmius oreades]
MSTPQKSRLPKAYTDQQLAFLRSHLGEFERRTQGNVRGDAKKFALERAEEFIGRFGFPAEFTGVEEPDARFREQIYNWFKNTVGRNRRKLEGRPKSTSTAATTWPSPPASVTTSAPSVPHPLPLPPLTALPPTLRDAFIQRVDPPTLANIIRSFVHSSPHSKLPLNPVIQTLFDAIQDNPPHAFIRLFLDASSYFTPDIIHAGISGPLAATSALSIQIRRNSIWVPSPPSPSTFSEEMNRISLDRQRKKHYINWARIHAASIDLGVRFEISEVMARDAVWQDDEVEWVAGVFVLRALIRASPREDYEGLLGEYESRWREMRDENRQAMVTDVLLGAREDLSKLVQHP